MSNIQQIYTQVISNLSPTERLQLATLILNDLVEQNRTVYDDSDTWTEEDQQDVTAFSLQYAATDLGLLYQITNNKKLITNN